MDPHITKEDAEIIQGSHHRRLRQRLAPPSPLLATKKKRLVNFKISRRFRTGKEKEERPGSASSCNSSFVSCDIPMTPLGSEADNAKLDVLKNATRRNLNERNFHRSLNEEDEDNYQYESHEEFRSLNNDHIEPMEEYRSPNNERRNSREDFRNLNQVRIDNRSVKERREDFRKIHGGRSESKAISARRGGILHISEASEKKILTEDEDTKNHNVPEAAENKPEHTKDDKNGNPQQSLQRTQTYRRHSSPGERITLPSNGNQQTDPNKAAAPTEKSKLEQRRRSAAAAMSQRSYSTVSWDHVRDNTICERRASKLSSVVEFISTRRHNSLAPSIWTPAIPRIPPNPRPVNFREQEEPGRRTFSISFITRAPKARQPKHGDPVRQRHPVHQESSVPSLYRVPTTHWESSGKSYMNWITDLVENPLLQDGHLLLGLEIGVQFPVVYLRESQTRSSASSHQLLEDSLGPECILNQGVYVEVVSWAPEMLVTSPSDPSQLARCYITLGFMTLDGELNKKMEVQWKEWTGSLYVYCNIDDNLGLKKLSFYRRDSRHKHNLFSYVVLIELDTVTRKNCLRLLDFVYRMRLRSMSGYISVYQSHYPEAGLTMVPGGSPMSLRARSPAGHISSSGDSHLDNTSVDLERMSL